MIPSQLHNISADFERNERDSRLLKKLLRLDSPQRMLKEFDLIKSKLSDYCFWYMLGTLYIADTTNTDIRIWKKLFNSDRPRKATSLMKPDEYAAFLKLPDEIIVYRAANDGESQGLSYSLSLDVAKNMAILKNASHIKAYKVHKRYITALFLRRKESEVLVAEPDKLEELESSLVFIVDV